MNRAFVDRTLARLTPREFFKTVVVVGSAPTAPSVARLLGKQTFVVGLNNSWRALPRYDAFVYADDLPPESKPGPEDVARKGRSAPQYYPAMEASGGILFCGASTGFAAGYWVAHTMPFSQVSYFAADMTYSNRQSHFYGKGSPDPLRKDLSLQDLPAKSLRLYYFGLTRGSLFLNASAEPETRLAFPRVTSGLSVSKNVMGEVLDALFEETETAKKEAAEALALEKDVPFDATVSDYWRYADDQKAWAYVARINAAWHALEASVRRVTALVSQAKAFAA